MDKAGGIHVGKDPCILSIFGKYGEKKCIFAKRNTEIQLILFQMKNKERTYIAIDLKSFYASVECVERGLDPLTTNLVVADASRTEKTICLAVSPSLKAYGIGGRARLFEVVQHVREVNNERRQQSPQKRLTGKSSSDLELKAHPDWAVDYIAAPPRMAHYIACSAKIYEIYLGTVSVTESGNFGALQNFTAKILSDGNIIVAGYYTDSYTNTATHSSGYYYYKFDPQTESISDIHNYSFSNNYVEKNAWARFANVLGNQQYSITADNIYELENGNIVFCGEHRFTKAIYDNMTNSYSYQFLTKNILVATFLDDGTSLFSMIEKQQLAGLAVNIYGSWSSLNISYSAFAYHNDMYFVFNDDNKNIPYPGKDAVCTVGGLTFPKNIETVLMRLTAEQELSQKVLRDPNQHFYAIEFTDDNTFYTTGVGKSDLYFNKYTVEE